MHVVILVSWASCIFPVGQKQTNNVFGWPATKTIVIHLAYLTA